jgi:predicted glycosyltransferase
MGPGPKKNTSRAYPTANTSTAYAGTGAGLRVLIYSHDTFGLGHLRRCLKISQALKRRFPDLSILLVTGSPQVHRYRLPPGIDYVKLPAVRKTADEQYEPRHIGMTFERVFNLRSHMLLDTVRDFLPHALLVDHSPLGMKSEMRPSLEWLRENSPATAMVLGLRDILDEPEKIVARWREQSMYELLDKYYDRILIYGSRMVFDPVTAYCLPPRLAERADFCGYITEPETQARGAPPGAKSGRKSVLVTTGGGDGDGEAVVGTFIDMMRSFKGRVDFDTLVITGPFVSDELWRESRARARGLPVTIRRFVNQTRPFLQRSDLVISTGGYNTTTEILTYASRALIIPRMMYRSEQLLRASRLRDMGLVSLLHPEEATPERLFEIVTAMLASPREPLVEARNEKLIELCGTERLVGHFGELFARMMEKELTP